jgi:hypothetical protein
MTDTNTELPPRILGETLEETLDFVRTTRMTLGNSNTDHGNTKNIR